MRILVLHELNCQTYQVVKILINQILTKQPCKQPAVRHLRSFTNDTGGSGPDTRNLAVYKYPHEIRVILLAVKHSSSFLKKFLMDKCFHL